MSATPKDIAVDIHDLLKAGRTQIPAVADQYSAAADGLNVGAVGFALIRDSSLGTGPTGVLPQWADCCDAVVSMLKTEAATMKLIGEALVDIALREFEDTDQRARDKYVDLYGRIS